MDFTAPWLIYIYIYIYSDPGSSPHEQHRVSQKKGNPILDYLSARENTSYHNSNIVKSNLDVLRWSVQNMENEFS